MGMSVLNLSKYHTEFEQIDRTPIRSTLMRMYGAAGPSGIDASHCKEVCLSFAKESDD